MTDAEILKLICQGEVSESDRYSRGVGTSGYFMVILRLSCSEVFPSHLLSYWYLVLYQWHNGLKEWSTALVVLVILGWVESDDGLEMEGIIDIMIGDTSLQFIICCSAALCVSPEKSSLLHHFILAAFKISKIWSYDQGMRSWDLLWRNSPLKLFFGLLMDAFWGRREHTHTIYVVKITPEKPVCPTFVICLITCPTRSKSPGQRAAHLYFHIFINTDWRRCWTSIEISWD